MRQNPLKFRMIWKCLLLLTFISQLAHAEWQPVKGGMMTSWGRSLKADAAWQEYPRPQLERSDWTNLNGLWNYAVTSKEDSTPVKWDGQILVPFCPESSLSGVGRLIEPTEALWYKRPLPGLKPGKRTLLNFEAVDYTTTVWVNGQRIGSHRGGFTPFSFDITPALKADGNELVVGPFQGLPACIRIPLDRGVCGAAARTRVTQRIDDVHAFEGHIACDAASRSELVVPLVDAHGGLVGVFDLDSPEPGRFDPDDQAGIEAIARIYIESIA